MNCEEKCERSPISEQMEMIEEALSYLGVIQRKVISLSNKFNTKLDLEGFWINVGSFSYHTENIGISGLMEIHRDYKYILEWLDMMGE